MKIQAEIVGGFETKSGNAKATGKAYSMTEQPALVTLPSGERKRMALGLEAPGDAFAPGTVLEPKDTAMFINGFRVELSLRAKNWNVVKAAASVKAA